MPFKPIEPNPPYKRTMISTCQVISLGIGMACALTLCLPAPAASSTHADTRPPMNSSQATLLIQSSPLAGSQFHDLGEVVHQIRVGDSLTLQREPANPHDANAIRVLWQDRMLGYVPRRENRAIARAMDRGQPLLARVVALRPDASPWQRLRFEISAPITD